MDLRDVRDVTNNTIEIRFTPSGPILPRRQQ